MLQGIDKKSKEGMKRISLFAILIQTLRAKLHPDRTMDKLILQIWYVS